jgi:ribosomal protein S18 acetylase RimI-like enzyme
MSMMRIKYLADSPNFRPIIASWLMQEWGMRYPERDLENWAQTQTYINKDQLPLTLIAIRDNELIEGRSDRVSNISEVIGTVSLRVDGMSIHPEWKAWISYLVVLEAYRGRGIAKELMQQVELTAQVLGIENLHLFTRLENPKLYTGLGWRKIGREFYRGGLVTVMNKII